MLNRCITRQQKILIITLIMLVFFCFYHAAAAAEPTEDLQQVSVQLKWKHQFQFAGFYAAIHQG